MGHGTDSPPAGSGAPAPWASLSRHGHKILALIPLAFLIWVVARYAVAVPYLDQWELVPLLEKTYHGELTFHDLWEQHSEHRILFPKIIMLILARLTGWNIRYELACNLVLALGIFAVLVGQLNMTSRRLGVPTLAGMIPAVSLIVFSIGQYQNWLWGWQLQMFLNLLAVTAGIVLLANEPFRWIKFAAAALLGVVANYSFANGALFWPIGLFLLLAVKSGARKKAVAGWLVIGTLTLSIYFYHYQKPQEYPPLTLLFKMPVEYAVFVFKYLGTICAGGVGGSLSVDGVLAFAFGLAGTVVIAWAGWMLLRRNIADAGTLLPYFGLSLYSIGSALLTGIGRLGFGTNQALASRYCTMVVPLWVSLVVFLFLLRTGGGSAHANSISHQHSERPALLNCRRMAGGFLWVAILLLVLGSICATVRARQLSGIQASGRDCLLDVAAHPASKADYRGLLAIYPRPEIVMERYPILVEHRLSLFKNAVGADVRRR
jgi:hypothetical protein